MLVSKGALVGTSSSYFPRYTFMPGMSSTTWPAAYGQLYRSQLWVYVVVSKRAGATARLPLPVYRRETLNRPRDADHPMARLLQAPNPAMSDFDLWVWTSSMRDIHGEAWWYKSRRRGVVDAIYPLHPSGMVQQEDGSWSFSNGRLRMSNIDPADLVSFRGFNPDSLTRGMSALEPLRATLENEFRARQSSSAFWNRGARPGFVLRHPKNISAGAMGRLRDQFEAQHEGAENAGSTLLLEEGMDAQQMSLSAEEAQYIETRKLNREEVCAAFDMPPPVVHILDRATFSNITEQMRSLYRDTMAPHLAGLEASIELDLRRAEWPDDDVYAEFLMDGVLRGDFEKRQDALSKATHYTLAEKRELENLPFVEGTDQIFLHTALAPLSAITSGAAGITPDDVQPADLPRELDPSTVRSLMGRLGWQRTIGDVDIEALVVGLGDDQAEAVRTLAAAHPEPTELKLALRAAVAERWNKEDE